MCRCKKKKHRKKCRKRYRRRCCTRTVIYLDGRRVRFRDPMDEDGFGEIEDPMDEDGFGEIEDPMDEDGFGEIEDPDGYRRRRRRRCRLRRRRCRKRRPRHALCGDFQRGGSGNAGRPGAPEQYSGFITVRLIPELALADYDDLEELAQGEDLEGLKKVLEKYKLSSSRRVVQNCGPREDSWTCFLDYIKGETDPCEPQNVAEIEREAARGELPPLHSLAAYWRIDARHKTGKMRKIVKRLNKLAEVELAYRELAATDPSNGIEDEPFAGSQGYMAPAPLGIGSLWARAHPGGRGDGVGIVDLERGWFENHQDLPDLVPLHGDNLDGVGTFKGDHGTAVLGEMVAKDGNCIGVASIAPGVARVGLASHYNAASDTQGYVAEAIVAAITALDENGDRFLKAGDVLLLEVQRDYKPVEIDHADFTAIRAASSLGIIVVEAAGNSGYNLDGYRDETCARIFCRGSSDFRESGAIMVGAALSALPHKRKRSSNYGSRIDCYAWGNNVVSAGYGDPHAGVGDNETYTGRFANTSAAAAIIAGAAMVVQSMYERAIGRRLSPAQMRAVLSDPATGTPQGRGRRGRIGVMPDLRAIAQSALRIVPDVYIRDNVADLGVVPVAERTCVSPDLWIRREPEAEPETAFGAGSKGLTPGSTIRPGEHNHVYVTIRNRGRGDADDVTATVFCSEAATLVTPDLWYKIGEAKVATVPQGDTPVVAGPISWDAPSVGSFCLVAVLHNSGDPAPRPPGLVDHGPAHGLRRPLDPDPPHFE